jgi:predicted XRE-type DNA-binding protein
LAETRVIYVARFQETIYVLHAFQKKSRKQGMRTLKLPGNVITRLKDEDMEIVKSCGNVFADLRFPPEEATLLFMRATLMANLRETIEGKGWTQAEAAEHLDIGQSRVSDLVRGKWEKFSLDMLDSVVTRLNLWYSFRVLYSERLPHVFNACSPSARYF